MVKKQTKPTRAERLRLGTQQRRERQKQELRQTILSAAAELFLEHGYEHFSLRQVAEHIGYSPGTIYLHFKDKDELLFTVAEEGFAKFGCQMMATATSIADPLERLCALGCTYVDFGLKNPAYYQLMFIQRPDFLVGRPEFDDHKSKQGSFQILQQTVEQGMEAGLIRCGDPLITSDILWSLVHGIVALALRMSNFFDEDRAQQVVEASVALMRDGLQPR